MTLSLVRSTRREINGDRNDVKSGAQHQEYANGDNNEAVQAGAQRQDNNEDKVCLVLS